MQQYFRAKYDEEKKKSDKRYAEIQKEHRDLKKKHEKLSQTAKKVFYKNRLQAFRIMVTERSDCYDFLDFLGIL